MSRKITGYFFDHIFEDRRTWWLCIAAVLVLAIFLQASWWSVPLERDEGEYAYIARLLLEGGVPYRDAFNQKPPVVFFLYAGAFLLFGQTIKAIHIFKTIYSLVTLGVFYLLSRKFYPKKTSLLAMAVFAVLTSEPAFQGNAANTEIFLLLPMILGFYLLFVFIEKGKTRYLLFSGLSAGTAFMTKQVVAFPILLMMSYILFYGISRKPSASLPLPPSREGRGKNISRAPNRLKRLPVYFGLFALGGTLPLFLAALFFSYHGALSDFIQCAFIHNFRYSGNIPLHYYFQIFQQRMTERLLPPNVILFLVMAVGLLVIIIRIIRRSDRDESLFTFWFFLFSVPGVMVGGYFRPHYFILLHPAMALLAAFGIVSTAEAVTRLTKTGALWKRLLYFMMVLCILGSPVYSARHIYSLKDPLDKSKAIYTTNPFKEALEIGQYLKEHTRPEDSIFIFGSEPEILFYAQRRSATRYIIFYPLMNGLKYSLSQQKEAYRELVASKPKYIVIVEMHESLQIYPNADKFIMEQVSGYLQAYKIEGLFLYDEIGLWPTAYWAEESKTVELEPGRENIRIYRRI